jgi:hypothetical protein
MISYFETAELESIVAAPWRFTEDHSLDHDFERPYTSALRNILTSLEEDGQLSPIHVRPLGELYQIVDGHVVVDAARQLGFRTLNCMVHHDLDDDGARLLYIHFNLNRAAQYHVKIHRIFGQIKDVPTLLKHVSWDPQRVQDYVDLDESGENWKRFMENDGEWEVPDWQ